MRLSKKILSVFICTLFTTVLVSKVYADGNCADCDDKKFKGLPKVAVNGMTKIASMAGQNPSVLFNYQTAFCMKYQQIQKNLVNSFLREMATTPFPIDQYLTSPVCRPQKATGKSPMLHLTAEAPCTRVEFPQIIYKYYHVKRNNPALWLEVINAKNSSGETFLDYIETLNIQGQYNTPESKACVNNLVVFACESCGIYTKYAKHCTPSTQCSKGK